MDKTVALVLDNSRRVLPSAGDRLVDLVHRAVTGKRMRGDPDKALHDLVQKDLLTPQAALYLGGVRQALHEVAEAISGK